jgi:hypothetical protein
VVVINNSKYIWRCSNNFILNLSSETYEITFTIDTVDQAQASIIVFRAVNESSSIELDLAQIRFIKIRVE